MEHIETQQQKILIETNKYQTSVTQELLDSLPEEVSEQLLECLNNIEFVKNLISRQMPMRLTLVFE
jgi:hypothetical protein